MKRSLLIGVLLIACPLHATPLHQTTKGVMQICQSSASFDQGLCMAWMDGYLRAIKYYSEYTVPPTSFEIADLKNNYIKWIKEKLDSLKTKKDKEAFLDIEQGINFGRFLLQYKYMLKIYTEEWPTD